MPEFTTFLPKYESDPEYNAELLRQSVPLMIKNNVSTHPINYAIWYEYAAGNNGQLNGAINSLVQKHETFDDNISLNLYKDYICNASIEAFENINSNLNGILDSTQNSVRTNSTKVSNASDNFKNKSLQLENIQDANELKTVLNDVISETKQLTEITRSVNKELNNAQEEIEKLRNELNKVKEMASTDALTGLLNRRAFDTEISNLIGLNNSSTHCLLILDLDHFKKVNDTFGHLVGDKVIRFTAGLLKKYSSAHHHNARYGGEEMAVIMPNTELNEALKIAESIRNVLSKSQLKQKDNGLSIGQITVSIGATILKVNDDSNSFIARADEALYEAKDSGRNKVVHH